MAKTTANKPNAEFTPAEYKAKHETTLQKRDQLLKASEARKVQAEAAFLKVAKKYNDNPTLKNYRNLKTAAVRRLNVK